MKVLELFCGTKSFSKVAESLGHETFTIDNNPVFKPNLCKNILYVRKGDIPFKPDIIWASPPCTCFSVASIGHHWTGGKEAYIPKTEFAKESINLVKWTVELINVLEPKYFFIENPRGVLRKLNLIPFPLKTCCYCQYGDKRMKPTDIWTNVKSFNPKMCHNGNKDHEEARRGAKTGTQGLKGSIERGVVPEQLCRELLKCCDIDRLIQKWNDDKMDERFERINRLIEESLRVSNETLMKRIDF